MVINRHQEDSRRVGRFLAPEEWVLNQEKFREELSRLLEGSYPLFSDWVEEDWYPGLVSMWMYTAIHPDFDVFDGKGEPPIYKAVYVDGKRIWEKSA